MVDMSELKKLHDDLSRGSGYDFWRPKEEKNLIRILPAKNLKGQFYIEAHYHRKLVDSQTNVLCPKLTFGKPCPICEVMEKLQDDSKTSDMDVVGQLRPYRRFYMNIIDMKTPEQGVKVYGAPKTVFRDLLSYFVDPDWGDLTDPKKGYDIEIERIGTGISTEYTVRAKKKSTAIDESVLENIVNLEDLLRPKAYDDLLNFLDAIDLGGGVSNSSSQESIEEPKKEIKEKSREELEEELKKAKEELEKKSRTEVEEIKKEEVKEEKKEEVDTDYSKTKSRIAEKLAELKRKAKT